MVHTCGKNLSVLVPDLKLKRYETLDIDLPPFDEEEFWKFVPDEESSQVKGLSFLADSDICGLRILSDPEPAHPKWNGLNRSSDKSQLRGAILKATAICNWHQGPMGSGSNGAKGKEALALRLRDNATLEWLEERVCLIADDMDLPDDSIPETEEEMRAQWDDYLKQAELQVVQNHLVRMGISVRKQLTPDSHVHVPLLQPGSKDPIVFHSSCLLSHCHHLHSWASQRRTPMFFRQFGFHVHTM